MFIRIKTTPNSPRKSVQLVESYRDNKGKPRQKIFRHVGIAQDDHELEAFKNIKIMLVDNYNFLLKILYKFWGTSIVFDKDQGNIVGLKHKVFVTGKKSLEYI